MINQARTPASVGDNDKVMGANEELMPDAFLFIFSSVDYITSALAMGFGNCKDCMNSCLLESASILRCEAE